MDGVSMAATAEVLGFDVKRGEPTTGAKLAVGSLDGPSGLRLSPNLTSKVVETA
jgi:hypothetical protein